ncbi:MAG TPA: CPCC family cysteine-rich protein [Acidimicrobiia bacterium]
MPDRVVRGPDDDPSLSDEQLVAQRNAWFERYTSTRNVFAPRGGGPYTCPCCGHRTLAERGGYDICRECRWEDDGQDDHDSGEVRGGPNGRLSLDAAREQYTSRGGVCEPHAPPSEPR